MTTVIKIIVTSFLLLLFGCNTEPTLQKYFVENSEKSNFTALDLSPKMLNIDNNKLSIDQKEALGSFEKMNLLTFKVNKENFAQFEAERNKVVAILKDKKYQQLMKFGSGKDGAQVSFVGTDDNIEEFVIFGNKKENGFAVVRVLGKNMNPTHILNMMSVLQNANIDPEQLKPLQELFK